MGHEELIKKRQRGQKAALSLSQRHQSGKLERPPFPFSGDFFQKVLQSRQSSPLRRVCRLLMQEVDEGLGAL